MDRSTETRPGFFGTYFDRDGVLRVARLAGMLAWALLILYIYTTVISVSQFWSFAASGETFYETANLFDLLSIPAQQVSLLVPGLVYFIMLKVAQQILLILLDVEDNSRRAARK